MQADLSRLEEQLGKALEGEAWHGPSVLEILEGVSARQAAAHPIAGAHSIWELVLHLCGTYGLVLRRLGGDGRQLTEAEDWPAVPEPSAENWEDAIRLLKRLNADLIQVVSSFPTEHLDQPLVPEAPYTAYTQFIGVTQHNLYHAGQMALLKKAMGFGLRPEDGQAVGKMREFMMNAASRFYARFSLRELVGLQADRARPGPGGGIGGFAGGIGGGSGHAGFAPSNYQKSESCSLSLEMPGDNRFDEAGLIAALKEEVKRQIIDSGSVITFQGEIEGNFNSSEFYCEYAEGNIQGRIIISGKVSGGAYRMKAELEERGFPL